MTKDKPRNQPAAPIRRDRKPRPDMDRRASENAVTALHPQARKPQRNPELTRDAQDNANHEQWEEEENPAGGMYYSTPPRPEEAD